MTNLDEEQLALLEKVKLSKSAADLLIADAYRRYEDEVWKLEETLRAAAKTAYDAGVPLRKIGTAIGTTDHRTQKSYVSGPRRYEGEGSYEHGINPETNERMFWKNDKEFTVVDYDGYEYQFWTLVVDGYTIVNRAGDKSHPLTDYVRNIIIENLPEADISEL